MRVVFMCPSSPHPVGGVLAMYGYANGLARRGHDVVLAHVAMWGRGVNGPEDLARFSFHDAIQHYFPGDVVPPDAYLADISFGIGSPPSLGLPVALVQGLIGLGGAADREAFLSPCLKVCVARWLVDVGTIVGVPPGQLVHVPPGIDHGLHRQVSPPSERSPRVAMLHNGHPAKGWSVGLAVLEEVHRSRPDAEIVVFGTSPPDHVPPWVQVLVDPSREVLSRDVYNASQVFLQPSNCEGFGLVGVEAMACGAALVTTDNGGSRDYAEHGRTALVAAPRDVSGLADHVTSLLDDPGRRLTLASAGRRSVQRFTWDRAAERLERHLLAYLDDPDRFQAPSGPEPSDVDWTVEALLERTAGAARASGPHQ